MVNELQLPNDFASRSGSQLPFWANDTTFGFLKSYYYNFESWDRVVVAYEDGKWFRSIYEIFDYRIAKIVVGNDNVLYISITTDIFNSIEILKCVHRKNDSSCESTSFYGDIYPEFTVLDDDLYLISSMSDSLRQYDLTRDTLITFETNLEIGDDFGLFYELAKGKAGEVLGIRSDGIYRSLDNGVNWEIVLAGDNFRTLRQESPGRWWVMQRNPNENELWRSLDGGVIWTALFSVDQDFTRLEAVYPDWYWIGSYNATGKILYGRYNNVSVSGAEESEPHQFSFIENYPNPFNLATAIRYEVHSPGMVQIDVYNINGQFITNLLRREQSTGAQEIKWDGRNRFGHQLNSGIYLLKFSVNDLYVASNKMLLLK